MIWIYNEVYNEHSGNKFIGWLLESYSGCCGGYVYLVIIVDFLPIWPLSLCCRAEQHIFLWRMSSSHVRLQTKLWMSSISKYELGSKNVFVRAISLQKNSISVSTSVPYRVTTIYFNLLGLFMGPSSLLQAFCKWGFHGWEKRRNTDSSCIWQFSVPLYNNVTYICNPSTHWMQPTAFKSHGQYYSQTLLNKVGQWHIVCDIISLLLSCKQQSTALL